MAEYLETIKEWKDYANNQLQITNIQECTELGKTKDEDGKVEIEDNFLYR